MMLSKIFGKNKTYKFREPENTACMTCSHVLEGGAPILYVTHDADDGTWQFLCGSDNHDESHAKIVALKEIAVIDPSVNDLFEMPLGVDASRESKNANWRPFKL